VDGKILQDCDVYIGRACRKGGWDLSASKWANPFPVASTPGGRDAAIARYEKYLRNERPDLLRALPELGGGRTLGCWCAPKPCHGDVLVRLFLEHSRGAAPP
jgi:hypothetical protein